MTELRIRRDERTERYVGRLSEGEEAVLDYAQVDAGVREMKSTFVPEQRRGTGLGRRLVRHALDEARSEGMKVIPTCPFVARVIAENSEYQGLVAGERARA